MRKIVLLSSAAAYGADYHNPGLIRESRPRPPARPNRVADGVAGRRGSRRPTDRGGRPDRLTILRPSMTRVDGATDWVNRLFRRRWAVTVAGYNPSIQLLEAAELAEAIGLAVASDATGVFNIAPDGVVPLHYALRAAGVRRLPLPWTPQWLGAGRFASARRGVLGRSSRSTSATRGPSRTSGASSSSGCVTGPDARFHTGRPVAT